MARKSGGIVTALLLLACLAIIGVLAYTWLNPPVLPQTNRLATSAQQNQVDISQQLTGIAAQEEYQEIIERPLFLSSRRPPPPEPPKVEEPKAVDPPEEEKTLVLQGVISVSGNETALLLVEETGVKVRLKIGEQVNDWTLQSIAPNSVTLGKGDKTVKELPLIRNRKPPPAAKPKSRQALRKLERKQRLEARRAARRAKIQAAKNRAKATQSPSQ